YLSSADRSFGGLRPLVAGESEQSRCGFEFGSVLTPDAYDRLRRMGIVRSFEFSISLPGVRSQDRELGRSLSEILDGPLPDGVETITITMKAGRGRDSKLGRQGVMKIVDDLRALHEHVSGGKVVGKQDAGMRADEVDLLSDRICREVNIPAGEGQRYSSRDRWRVLAESLHQWLVNGTLQSLPR
ncbi:MAG: hypothetical protein U1D69_11345, partial [Polynucleobacter sp.]|nr:hypothetical protein [Polynucleobacter sp.]